MLSTELLTISVIFALCFVAVLMSIRLANVEKRVDAAIETLRTRNARSVSLAKMAYVETSLSELTDAYDALLQSHKKLRSRIGMRAVRESKIKAAEAIPDPQTDPAGYKKAMRNKIFINGK